MNSNSSSVTSLSFFHAIERMVEEDNDEEQWSLDSEQLKANEWVPRIAGVITFISSLCMMWMAWNRRDRLFHRLVLGMSSNLLVQGIFSMYGTAAIGTIATCTTQGFFIYVTGITSIFYYGSFSIYSYVGVLNNFEKSKIIWIEKYIHILVHIYPYCSAFYILSQEGFNDFGLGICFLYGSPIECWLDPSIPCERGLESRLMIFLWIIPLLLALLLPSIVMAVLFVRVRKCKKNIRIDAKSIAKQGVRIY